MKLKQFLSPKFSYVKNLPNATKLTSFLVVALVSVSVFSGTAQAEISNNGVNGYSQAMKSAANAKSIDGVSKLVSDDALIKFTRNGKNSTLDKSGYLKLLQDRWVNAENYKYHITLSNIIITGNKAIAEVKTVETFTEKGRLMEYVSESKATLIEVDNQVVLSKFKSNVSIK